MCCEYKRVSPRVKHIDIPIYFLQEQFDNGPVVPKYDNYSVVSADMWTKPYAGSVIIRSNKFMPGFIFYQTSDT